MDFPRVLLVSHSAINISNSVGRATANYFLNWPQDKLAELYFQPEIPTTRITENYYRVTDLDILRSLLKFKKPGRQIVPSEILDNSINYRETQGGTEQIYSYGKKRKPYTYVLRNLIWDFRTWNTKEFKRWLSDFAPEVIVFFTGGFTFSFKIVNYISCKFNIPVVTITGDDHYITDPKYKSLFWLMNRKSFCRIFTKTMSLGKEFICTNEFLTGEYEKCFDAHGTTLMISSELPIRAIDHIKKIGEKKLHFIYGGNINMNRYKALLDIAKAFQELGELDRMVLDIYSSETDEDIINKVKAIEGISFHGSVSYAELCEKIEEADVLVHVESFDEVLRIRTRYSMSTKISDYLTFGKPILAYGPQEVSSIRLFDKYKCGIVATSFEELLQCVEKIKLYDYDDMCSNAQRLANEVCNGEQSRRIFEQIICRAKLP